jgi:hypothetical protein
VEGRWSPSLRSVIDNSSMRRRHMSDTCVSSTRGVFLSQAGPRVGSVRLFKLSITSGWVRRGSVGKRRRRPGGSPSSGLQCGFEPSALPPG